MMKQNKAIQLFFMLSIIMNQIFQYYNLVMLIKLITVYLLVSICATQICQSGCIQCYDSSQPYSCTSCNTTQQQTIYMLACHSSDFSDPLFITFSVLLLILYIFMLLVGIGVYHFFFENIQLASIISWGYGSQSGASVLQSTNLAIQMNNDFPSSFGGQFITIMCIMFIFWVIALIGDKFPHKPTATLIERKRIIFPTRFIGFFYTMIMFSSLAEISTLNDNFTLFSLVLAILALLKGVVIFAGSLFLCNIKKFKVDDPEYYVITEKLTNSNWFSKNNLFVSMINKTIIIFTFTFGFSQPQIAGIIIIVSQSIFTIYCSLLPWMKLRYRIINLIGNLLFVGTLLCSMGCGINAIGGQTWNQYKVGYFVIIIVMCSVLFLAMLIEIIIQRHHIQRQLKSTWKKYCICEKTEEQNEEYNLDTRREQVIKMQPNSLYQRDVASVNQ